MAKLVTVPVVKTFTYGGQKYAKGHDVTMSPIDAAVYARRGFVSLTARLNNRRPTNNRQMVAEDVTTAESQPRRRTRAGGSEQVPGAHVRSRRYQRTDMTAEDPE